MLCFLTGPTLINALASSSTSIIVSWNSGHFSIDNGAVIGYRVLYVDEAVTRPKLNVSVGVNISSIELTDLLVYTNYCIQVLAFSSQGDGNTSDCLFTFTGMNGKKKSSYNDIAYVG